MLTFWTSHVALKGQERHEVNITPGRPWVPPGGRHDRAQPWVPSPAAWEPWKALAGSATLRKLTGVRQKAYYLFEAAYLGELRARTFSDPGMLEALFAEPSAVLVCECPWPDLCPRHTAAGALQKMGAIYLGEREIAPTDDSWTHHPPRETPPPPAARWVPPSHWGPPRRNPAPTSRPPRQRSVPPPPREPREPPAPRAAPAAPSVSDDLCTLGLDPRGVHTPTSVRDAWRRRVREVHPDAPGGSQEAFVAVAAAHQRLKNLIGEP